jgi:DNA-directed RNA polymerase specialized sigma24 family protein
MSRPLQPDWFEALLRCLDPDRDRAGLRYQELHQALGRIFRMRGARDPALLIDDTLDRVGRRAAATPEAFAQPGAIAAFARGVAANVMREAQRGPRFEAFAQDPEAPPPPDRDREPRLRCLDHCLAALAEDDRRTALAYYALDKSAGIARRAALAAERGITRNAMRIRMSRLVAQLEQCVLACLGRPPAAAES